MNAEMWFKGSSLEQPGRQISSRAAESSNNWTRSAHREEGSDLSDSLNGQALFVGTIRPGSFLATILCSCAFCA
jgi:hypothetical protein